MEDKTEEGKTEMVSRLIPLMVILLGPAFILQPACGLEDGRIGVLYVGCIARSTPFWYLRADPLFSFNFVQATLRDWAGWGAIQQAADEIQVKRIIRLYMPRTYKDLTSRFDVIILANANRFAVGLGNIEMLAKGVRESGMGLLMSGGWESFGGSSNPTWGDTSIGKLLPTEDVVDFYIMAGRLIIDEHDNEFMSSLPWDPMQPFMNNYHHNLVTVKHGADLLAHVESLIFKDHPGMVTWELDNGTRTFALTGEIIGPGSEPGHIHTMCCRVNPWKYAIDFGSNLMIYLDRRPVPQDIELVHLVRARIFETAMRKRLLLSLLEFCDSFGVNTEKMMISIDEVDDVISEARPQYLELRFEDMLETYRKVDKMLTEIEQDAIRLKNRALLWVYLIEWLAVTGTSMICGFVLWTIMVRHRLYREVQTTRYGYI